MIKIIMSIEDHVAKVIDSEILAANSAKVDVIEISKINDAWDGRNLYANFKAQGVGPITVPVYDGRAIIPWEVLEKKVFTVGFFWTAADTVMTSTLATITVKDGAGINGSAAEPTPEIYTRFAEDAAEARALLEEALSKQAQVYFYNTSGSEVQTLLVDIEGYVPHASDAIAVFINGLFYTQWTPRIVGDELWLDFNPAVSGDIKVMIISALEFVTDTFLTQPGAAADAKVTGDNVRRIDNALNTMGENIESVSDSLAGTQSDVNALRGRMATAEGNISSIGSRVTAAENNITGVQTDVTALQGSVDGLTRRMSDAEGDIDTNTLAISGLDNRVTALENLGLADYENY